ncbi:glucans biosynthesis glucosyltransferase MdoH [Aurantimonas sp. HBX-1]|uniref:glucans biosynthesis glucosyltransferase MdoH n=1 Tax=Aurantimonas sp. HBX-1 TaxID=2906072 RepID=UPI001F3D527C|nr:glucans biosynthesis glucosyltransferase MdoH [Aurantimonas sp. HBX-1]UIJ71368.1 glucans biosynthesis glucosyltransferase MdoH [Aurantimonas sp. HBX-1]
MLRVPSADDELSFPESQERHRAERPPELRPAGLPVGRRRLIVLALNLATLVALAAGVVTLLRADGAIDAAEWIMLTGFLLATPWTVLGFWNAVIGLVLMHGPADPARSVYPYYSAGPAGRVRRLNSRTALTVFLRNEDPRPIFERIEAMRISLERTGLREHFRFFVLSDTSDPQVARAEEAEFRRFATVFADSDPARPVYRRRADNVGYKAGNVRDFLEAHGDDFDFYLPLDSDSVMSGDVMARLVATMEANPRFGILQSLVVGTPATSGFARIFQFGMRHGMRSFTMGASWWTADCGSYWGHNAVIRTRAFRDHCELPILPGRAPLGGHVLSHDQLEAVLMRRAGYEVRIVPVETQSYETSPPTLPEFAKRDLRWCQGNMQYWRFLRASGLLAISRFQILQAILMYLAPPAWIAMTIAATVKGVTGTFDPAYLQLGLGLFLTVFTLSIAPKLAGMADVLMTRGAVRAYGGPVRFIASALIEIPVSMLMAPIVAVYVSLFLAGLPFGRSVTWSGQNRDKLGVGWVSAFKAMWPQTLLGFAMAVVLYRADPVALLWGAPFVAGLCLAVPFTVITASARFGKLVARAGLFATPEESILPRVLRGLVPFEARPWRGAPARPSPLLPIAVPLAAEVESGRR